MTKATTLDVATLESSVVPVQADDAMSEAARKILLDNLIEMLKHQAKLSGDDSIHHIHQMRVATRRIRSALRVFGVYYEPETVSALLKGLRSTARVLGAARDLDVMQDNMRQASTTLSGEAAAALTMLIERLEGERAAARRPLNEWLASDKYQRFLQKFTTFATTPEKGTRPRASAVAPYQVRHVVPVLVHQHLANVRAYEGLLEDAPYERLHALRIEFKRLRYLLNFLADVLGASAGDFIDEVKVMQDHLGTLNDAVVAHEYLSDAKRLTAAQRETLAPYLTHLEETQARLIAELPTLWTHFNTRTLQRKLADALLVMR